MLTVSAWRGEFGLKVYSHAPQVYALCQREPCTVEIEEGEQALYPAADSWQVTDRADDDTRYGSPPDLGVDPERFVPEPHVKQLQGSPDVVICPRERDYGSEKNWHEWPYLASKLNSYGVSVYAAGAPDSSMDVPCHRAWEYERFLDASIEMIRAADLVIATDAGLAHLAVLCGADLLLVTYRGRVAPGPVVTSSGNVALEEYWYVKMHRYRKANHKSARIERVDGWEHPDRVIERVAVPA